MSNNIKAQDVREAAMGQWGSILQALNPRLSNAIAANGRHVACPEHGGKDGYRMFKDFENTGGSVCNTCGSFSDGFETLMWSMDWKFPETVQAIAEHLGIADVDRNSESYKTAVKENSKKAERLQAQLKADRAKRDATIEKTLNRVWSESVPLDDPMAQPVIKYLSNRGLALSELPTVLRCHPALGYYEKEGNGYKSLGEFPCMVALVQDKNGKAISLHRTYLTQDGEKAAVSSPKKLMEARSDTCWDGAAIRLHTPAQTLGYAEGLETSLAVNQARGMPMWCTINYTLMEKAWVPEGVKLACFWADYDESKTGQKAARKTATRVWQEGKGNGVSALALIPPAAALKGRKGVDWMDILAEHGPDGFVLPRQARKLLGQ